MKLYGLIFIGGGIGSCLRYAIAQAAPFGLKVGDFPLGVCLVNLMGCALIGALSGYAVHHSNYSALALRFWTTGFCGGFTTFSTFSLDNLQLLQKGNYTLFCLNVGLSVFLGLLFCGIAHQWAQQLET